MPPQLPYHRSGGAAERKHRAEVCVRSGGEGAHPHRASTIITKDGRVRNGSLIYNIRPIQEALEQNYQRQFQQAERDIERARAEKRLAELNRQNKKEESA